MNYKAIYYFEKTTSPGWSPLLKWHKVMIIYICSFGMMVEIYGMVRRSILHLSHRMDTKEKYFFKSLQPLESNSLMSSHLFYTPDIEMWQFRIFYVTFSFVTIHFCSDPNSETNLGKSRPSTKPYGHLSPTEKFHFQGHRFLATLQACPFSRRCRSDFKETANPYVPPTPLYPHIPPPPYVTHLAIVTTLIFRTHVSIESKFLSRNIFRWKLWVRGWGGVGVGEGW